MGVVSLIWHVALLILYFTVNDSSRDLPITDGIMFWTEMVFNVLILLSNIQLLIKVDFVPLTPEEIERVEIEELKHRIEIKDHQRM